MPCWSGILEEINREALRIEALRTAEPENPEAYLHPSIEVCKRYLEALSEQTGRYAVVYGSAWIQKPQSPADHLMVSGADMDGFLEVVYHANGVRNLDLILHSPGGSPEAAEQIVTYLREKFDHIRVIVPFQAMSAATMMALAADEICMARHSTLGPTDPQFVLGTNTGATRYAAAHAIKEEFGMAKKDAASKGFAAWAPILAQYPVGIMAQCDHQIALTNDLVAAWLAQYMLKDRPSPKQKARAISKFFAGAHHHTHGRPLMRDELRSRGLKVSDMENNQEEQDLIMSSYHALTHLMGGTGITKAILSSAKQGFFRQDVQIPTGLPQE